MLTKIFQIRDRQELKVSKFESGFERYISVCINWIFWIFQIIAVFKNMKVSECVEMIDFFEISHVRTCWIFLKNYKFCRECFFSIVLNFQQVTFFVLFFFFVYCFFAVKSKFFEKFVLTHQVVDFHHLPNFSSGCQLSSLSELFIKLLIFITFRTFHQVVHFHHLPNFSSSCQLSSLSKVFITLSTFITFRSFHQLPTLYQSAMVLTLFQAKSCSLNLRWHTFSRKSNRRSVLKNEKENDSNKTYFWQQQAEWKDIFETHKYTSPVSTTNIAVYHVAFYFWMLLSRPQVWIKPQMQTLQKNWGTNFDRYLKIYYLQKQRMLKILLWKSSYALLSYYAYLRRRLKFPSMSEIDWLE